MFAACGNFSPERMFIVARVGIDARTSLQVSHPALWYCAICHHIRARSQARGCVNFAAAPDMTSI
jgi:heterodisulfide reductase subunit C